MTSATRREITEGRDSKPWKAGAAASVTGPTASLTRPATSRTGKLSCTSVRLTPRAISYPNSSPARPPTVPGSNNPVIRLRGVVSFRSHAVAVSASLNSTYR